MSFWGAFLGAVAGVIISVLVLFAFAALIVSGRESKKENEREDAE